MKVYMNRIYKAQNPNKYSSRFKPKELIGLIRKQKFNPSNPKHMWMYHQGVDLGYIDEEFNILKED